MSNSVENRGPTLHGVGPGWPEPPEDASDPFWVNGRSFPAVWRDTLWFTVGGLKAVNRFPRITPDAPWDYRPEPGSDRDIDQAIAAKLHLGVRMMSLLAQAEVVLVEPELVGAIPDWNSDEHAVYGPEARLPASPVFLDLEAPNGQPTSWEAPTWPLPFHLRGALCWKSDDVLSVVPIGSVGGVHPCGGTDYQAWARWCFLQGRSAEWPDPGPGDFLARASGEVRSWVDAEGDSVCMQQGVVANNLSRRVLSVLMAMEAAAGSLVEAPVPRQQRRRAQRQGQRVAMVPERFPHLEERHPREAASPQPASGTSEPCVVRKTHARLDQAHALWHEALEVYADPDAFVVKLNALISALRSVTWVLRREFANSDEFNRWYAGWETQMGDDPRMRWLVSARNAIEKKGDLEMASVARVRVIADWLGEPVIDRDAEPTADSDEIARRLQLIGLPPRVTAEGTLAVERRWTVAELAGDELLDVLAHCHGILERVVAEAHAQRGAAPERCVLAVEHPCREQRVRSHPSGRLPCMIATRERRTALRNLATGAPYGIEVRSTLPPDFDDEALRERYGVDEWEHPPQGADWFEQVHGFHEMGKRMLAVDGYHLPIVWLWRDDQPVEQSALHPEDQRDKYMMIEALAAEADRLGADAVSVTSEAWSAEPVPADDLRAELRPGEREDRTESLVTYALRKDGECRNWHTPFTRTDGKPRLEKTETDSTVPNALLPFVRVWESWPPS